MRTWLSIAVHGYGFAAVLYLVHLARPSVLLARVARWLVADPRAAQLAGLSLVLASQGLSPRGLPQGLLSLVHLVVAVFWVVDFKYQLPVAGAFVLPAAVAVLIPAVILQHGSQPLPEVLGRPLLPVHIMVAVLGVATFAVAAALGAMYLLMEREVKGKRFGLLFSRLPSLQVLDDLNRRLVLIGFASLSFTLVSGSLFMYAGGRSWTEWSPKELFTTLAWGGFGLLLHARHAAGWRGRRVALLTLAGFLVVLASFLASFPGAPSVAASVVR